MIKHSKRFRALGHRLPPVSKTLFGDREKHGRVADRSDPMWLEWENTYSKFYVANQRSGVGQRVNNAGYRILEKIDFTGKRVMEIGPGKAPHLAFFKSRPDHYTIVDIRADFLKDAAQQLEELKIPYSTILIDPSNPHIVPLANNSIDVLVTFYSLEHLHPLETFLEEYLRVLKPNGQIVGGIPAEGGLAWGLGRYFTSRRWLKKNSTIDPDKLICWEHPNFADEIMTKLSQHFSMENVQYWPLRVPIIDCNLIVSFVGNKPMRIIP